MIKKQNPISCDLPYSISVRCNNKDWFLIPMPEVWTIMENYLHFIHHAYGVEIISFVLMNNHFHLLARFPNGNAGLAMGYFMREVSRQLGLKAYRINHKFKNRYSRCLIDSNHYYEAVYKYIYRNPVKAGICQNVEDYPFSTMHGLLGKSKLMIPVVEDLTLFSSPERCLNWLNHKPSDESTEQIRKALRLSIFKLKRCRQTGKLGDLSDYAFLDAPHAQKESAILWGGW